ncbi:hypothetical protein V495_05241 [Pseudogymnoascus sp. VKM F-4514 (FW-929)]|nr:hypothetical protein V495_05241 [Pseudogymnoascus sp. VKM F-4514 (FW-929)]KFY58993.1 hypothetical protein V497_04537 [Pseudogymnoascus sp. VKM F-4516 (FW-969)]
MKLTIIAALVAVAVAVAVPANEGSAPAPVEGSMEKRQSNGCFKCVNGETTCWTCNSGGCTSLFGTLRLLVGKYQRGMDSTSKKSLLQRLGFGKSRPSKKETGELSATAVKSATLYTQRPSSAATNSAGPTLQLDTSSISISAQKAIKKGANLGLQELYAPPSGLTPAVDIVFLHGLTGNAYNTWYHDASQIHWPNKLLKEDIPDARILTFGYDADVTNWYKAASVNRIGNHAESLLGSVTRFRERTQSENRKLIFVAHSLGGLVVENALALSRSSAETYLQRLEACTIGLAFLVTPHLGSDKASWGTFGAKIYNVVGIANTSIIAVLEPDSEVLATIQKRFHEGIRIREKTNKPIGITCFHEELPYGKLGLIVDMKSATLPGYPCYSIHATHTGMTKFDGPEDQGYISVCGELERWTRSAREEQMLSSALQEECLRSLYFDGQDSREEEIAQALPETFDWIWKDEYCDFLSWLRYGRGIYWISGRPASGKSTMMKHLFSTALKNAEKNFKDQERPVIIGYFLDRSKGNLKVRTLEGIARSLLWQLLKQYPHRFDYILPLYKEMKRCRPSTVWKASELHTALKDTISHTPSRAIWIFLDALDEYEGDTVNIADFCKNLSTVASEKVRICVSSRPEPEITHTFRSEQVLEIQRHTEEDVKKYITHELQRVEHILDESTRDRIIEQISLHANGLFMWVRLVSREIVKDSLSGTKTSSLLTRVNGLRQESSRREMSDLYTQILGRIDDPRKRRKAELILAIVACMNRSLWLDELRFILKLRPSEGEDGNFERRIDALTRGLLRYQSRRRHGNGVFESHIDEMTGDLSGYPPLEPFKEMNNSSRRHSNALTGGKSSARSRQVIFSHETVSIFIRTLGHSRDTDISDDPILRAHQQIAQACIHVLQECEESSLLNPNQTYMVQTYIVEGLLQEQEQQKEGFQNRYLSSFTAADSRSLLEFRHYSILNWLYHLKEAKIRTAALNDNIINPPVSNDTLIHWRRLYLARFWEQSSASTQGRHPVMASLEFLILSTVPFYGLFSESIHHEHATLQKLLKEWLFATTAPESPEVDLFKNADPFVSVRYAPGYVLHIHSTHLLEASQDELRCLPIVYKTDGASWFRLYEASARLGVEVDLYDNIEISDCATVSDRDPFTTNVTMELPVATYFSRLIEGRKITPMFLPFTTRTFVPVYELLQDIRVLTRHYLQLKGWDHVKRCVRNGYSQDRLKQDVSKPTFASPLHHAAFYGLNILIGLLCECGANVNYVSKEAPYGTPLLAAIWGVEILDDGSLGIKTIYELFRRRADANLPGNGGSLGVITPLNAAVKLYVGYEKRVGLPPYNMKSVIEILLEEGAQVDPATRSIARSSSVLRKFFSNGDFSSNHISRSLSPFSSTPPMTIPHSRHSAHPAHSRGAPNATIGALSSFHLPGGSADHRLALSAQDEYMEFSHSVFGNRRFLTTEDLSNNITQSRLQKAKHPRNDTTEDREETTVA